MSWEVGCYNCYIHYVHSNTVILRPLASNRPHMGNFLHDSFLGGAQWLSGRVLDSRPRGRGSGPHRHHCVVVLELETFILA